jgi:SAM-dependent methyltransferase
MRRELCPISDERLHVLKAYHQTDHKWGAHGRGWLLGILELIDRLELRSVTDYGCGNASLGRMLRAQRPRLRVCNFDPAFHRFSRRPERADLVVCTSTLEYVEADILTPTLESLASITYKVGLISVRSNPHPLIVTAQNAGWWRQVLLRHFSKVQPFDVHKFRHRGLVSYADFNPNLPKAAFLVEKES